MKAVGRFLGLASVGLVFLGLSGSAAWAETTLCTAIASLPYTITVQGLYCLKVDFDGGGLASGAAITINTNNVVVDLNGHKIGNLGAGTGNTAIGIAASDRKNITVRNGLLRGFNYAIKLDDTGLSEGHVIEDIRADQSTFQGILVAGKGNVIRNNLVTATGGFLRLLQRPTELMSVVRTIGSSITTWWTSWGPVPPPPPPRGGLASQAEVVTWLRTIKLGIPMQRCLALVPPESL